MYLSRRSLYAASAILIGCAAKDPPALILPPTLPGNFNRTSMAVVPEGAAPAQIQEMGLKRATRAVYRNSVPLVVTAYLMGSGASAFELVQKWRAAPGLLYFHVDNLFVTLEAPSVDQAALNEVAKALEAHLR